MTPIKPTIVRNPVSLLGAVITTIAAVVFLVVFLADLFGLHENPYLGIVFFLVLPGFFILGLVLIPIGAYLERRRRRAGQPPAFNRWPVFDFNDPTQRSTAWIVVLLTCANIVIVSLASYRGIEYMDSVEFCGQVCHSVMKPEFTAYQDSPHSRVACIECHIGTGASWFVRSKLSGTRQVFAVMLNTYPHPLPSPVRNLRPARETCEQCHWPEEFHGDKVVRRAEYADDEKNSESVTTLQVHVGGPNADPGSAHWIHWHTSLSNVIEYITTDEKRQTIPYVRLTDRLGNVREYVVADVTPDQLAKGERRRMDCMDCHNRPSHPIAPTAEKAVDASISSGFIPPTLPYVRREAVRVLKATYPSQDAAETTIARELDTFYRTSYGAIYSSRKGEIDRAIRGTQDIYHRNVFPEMKVGFGTYENNVGHIDSPGCFRCHDDAHKSKDGHVIRQDCDLCHGIS